MKKKKKKQKDEEEEEEESIISRTKQDTNALSRSTSLFCDQTVFSRKIQKRGSGAFSKNQTNAHKQTKSKARTKDGAVTS